MKAILMDHGGSVAKDRAYCKPCAYIGRWRYHRSDAERDLRCHTSSKKRQAHVKKKQRAS
jgi:hypothetical protein